MTQHIFSIAEWTVNICFANEDNLTGMELLPSFEPFRTDKSDMPILFTITIDQALEPAEPAQCRPIQVCQTGNGDIVVDKCNSGGYQYLIKNIHNEDCALLQSSDDLTQYRCKVLSKDKAANAFGLNNAVMIAYAFSGALCGTLLVHASLVRHEGRGYAFIAPSGTGKSTQTGNWLKVIPDCDLMNDDNPVLRMVDGKATIYGSPWSGKTPCYRQVKASVGAITKIVRDTKNHVVPMLPLTAFTELLTSCSAMKWDMKTYNGICDTVSAVVETVRMYTLHCTAEPESAKVCHQTISALQ